MFPYLVLIFMPISFYFIAFKRSDRERGELMIGQSSYIKKNNLSIYIFFIILFLLLSFRGINIGNDTKVYEFYFEKYSKYSLYEVLYQEGDKIYIMLNWIISRITNNFQIFLSIIAAITLLPMYKEYSKDKEDAILKIILFMNMSVFVMLFSGIRQSLAIAVSMLAYECVKKKKKLSFILLSFIGLGLHHSAYMILLLYPIYWMKLKKKHLFVIVPSIVAVFVYNQQIFKILMSIISAIFGERYEADIFLTGAYTMIIVFAIFAIISYVIPDEKMMDNETLGLRNYLLFALLLQCFAPVHRLAMRMNYYFIIFIPMVLPKVFKYAKRERRQYAMLIKNVILAFFLIYYLYSTYVACVSGNSVLNTYPYEFFWSN